MGSAVHFIKKFAQTQAISPMKNPSLSSHYNQLIALHFKTILKAGMFFLFNNQNLNKKGSKFEIFCIVAVCVDDDDHCIVRKWFPN